MNPFIFWNCHVVKRVLEIKFAVFNVFNTSEKYTKEEAVEIKADNMKMQIMWVVENCRFEENFCLDKLVRIFTFSAA